MEYDWASFGLASLGGACMGTYPLFVKTDAMRAAAPSALAFQGYKSAWVLICGAMLVGCRELRGAQPTFVFSWWGVAAAAAWVPAGWALIAAVKRIGMGAAVLVFDGAAALVSFLVFWLVFHEPIREHVSAGGGVYVLAPLYLLSACLGMAGSKPAATMPHACCRCLLRRRPPLLSCFAHRLPSIPSLPAPLFSSHRHLVPLAHNNRVRPGRPDLLATGL
jgi:multidrug transporter EmrE-like cation transporter